MFSIVVFFPKKKHEVQVITHELIIIWQSAMRGCSSPAVSLIVKTKWENKNERERERKHVNESEKASVRESLQTWEECMIKGTHDGWGCALKGQNHFIDNL